MNTDVILDFFVENYIWFIIGGLILFVALIGFIADKKHLFSKKNKANKFTENSENEIINFDTVETNDVSNETISHVATVEQSSDINNNQLSDYNSNYMQENSTHIIDNEFADDQQQKINYMTADSFNNINDELEKENNESSADYMVNDSLTDSEIVPIEEQKNNIDITDTYIDDSMVETNSLSYQINDNKKEPEKIDNDLVEFNFSNKENINDVQINNIDADINKINNLVFEDEISQSNKIEEMQNSAEIESDMSQKIESSTQTESNKLISDLGDNPEQTLQVNYSQLKEMVEDIIAEKQNEIYVKELDDVPKVEKSDVNDNNLRESNQEGIKDIPLPSLDHIAVDAINQHDEDEDDVWKF